MNRLISGLATICVATVLAAPVAARAAQAEKSDDSATKTLKLLKAPETPAEFWDAVKFSLNVGRSEDAATYLDRLLESNPPDDLLITIRERDGAKVFPKLAVTPELSAKGRVLLERVEKAALEHARRPDRIQKFIGYLTKSPEHRGYAIGQLRNAGPDAVPFLLATLRDPAMAEHHSTILQAMHQLTATALPPLVAALESEDPDVMRQVIHVLGVIGNRDTVPSLRFIAESADMPAPIQLAAREAVSRIIGKRYADLPAANDELVAQARAYYEHRVEFRETSPGVVRLWRWVPREGLKGEEVPLSNAEESLGLAHCRQALALDPNFEPAQVALLSLALDKAFERAGVDQPLPEGPGRIAAESLAAGPELLTKVLVQALDEGRPAVAIGALKSLAQNGNATIFAAQNGRPSAISMALSSPDRRIQFAAAEAALGARPQQPYPGTSLIVPILARSLVAEGPRKAIVIDPDTARGGALASLVQEAGYECQTVPNARHGFAIVAESADYELILIDPKIHDPNLSLTIAQFRSDPRTSGIPIVVLGDRADDDVLSKFERRYPRVKAFLRPTTIDTLKQQLDPFLASLVSKPLTPAERAEHARRAATWFSALARGEIRGVDLRPAEPALIAALGNETIAPDVIVALGRLPGEKAQFALAQLVLDDAAAAPLRVAAAKEIAHSVRQFGSALTKKHIAALVELMADTDEPTFHQALAAVVGSLRPGVAESGARLRAYPTPPPAAPAATEGDAEPAKPTRQPPTPPEPRPPQKAVEATDN
jgi:HEAT repeat protein